MSCRYLTVNSEGVFSITDSRIIHKVIIKKLTHVKNYIQWTEWTLWYNITGTLSVFLVLLKALINSFCDMAFLSNRKYKNRWHCLYMFYFTRTSILKCRYCEQGSPFNIMNINSKGASFSATGLSTNTPVSQLCSEVPVWLSLPLNPTTVSTAHRWCLHSPSFPLRRMTWRWLVWPRFSGCTANDSWYWHLWGMEALWIHKYM